MKLTQKFTLSGNLPEPGGSAGIWMSLTPQEVADALASGSGPGVPDSTGAPVPGTIVPGELLQLNANGNIEPSTQAVLGTDFAKLYVVAFTGNDDRSGSLMGDCIVFHGGARFESEKFDAGTYTPGRPLVPSSGTPGNFAQKAAVGDNVQAVAFVGPLSTGTAGVLDIVMPQGSGI